MAAEAEEQRLASQEGGGGAGVASRPRFETIAYDVTPSTNQGLVDKFRDCDFTFGPDNSATASAEAAVVGGESNTVPDRANAEKTDLKSAQEKEKSPNSRSECSPPGLHVLVPAMALAGAGVRPQSLSPAHAGRSGPVAGAGGAAKQPTGVAGMLSISSELMRANKLKRRDTLAVRHSYMLLYYMYCTLT